MTPEAKVKAKVRDALKRFGAYYVMPVTGGYGRQGAPDFLVCHNGHFIGVECKAGKGVVTPLQQKNLRDIQEAKGCAIVINENNLADLEGLLLKLSKEQP